MSLKTISESTLGHAVDNFDRINVMMKEAVDIRVRQRMGRTIEVGFFFKRTVNYCEYMEKNCSFFSHTYTEDYIRKETTIRVMKRLGIDHLKNISHYRSMLNVPGSSDIQADELMCSFIDIMSDLTPLVAEKILAKYYADCNK